MGQHNGDLRLFFDKFEINVDRHTKNVDPPHLDKLFTASHSSLQGSHLWPQNFSLKNSKFFSGLKILRP